MTELRNTMMLAAFAAVVLLAVSIPVRILAHTLAGPIAAALGGGK